MALRYALSDGKRECTGLSGCSAFERGCVKFALETGTSFLCSYRSGSLSLANGTDGNEFEIGYCLSRRKIWNAGHYDQ